MIFWNDISIMEPTILVSRQIPENFAITEGWAGEFYLIDKMTEEVLCDLETDKITLATHRAFERWIYQTVSGQMNLF